MDSKWAAEQLNAGNKITKDEWDTQCYIVKDGWSFLDEHGKQWSWNTFDILYTGWKLWKEPDTLTNKIDNAISFGGDVKVIPLDDVKSAIQEIADILSEEHSCSFEITTKIDKLLGEAFLFKYM